MASQINDSWFSYLTSVTNCRRGLSRQSVRFVVCDYLFTAFDLRDSLPSRHAPRVLLPTSNPDRPQIL